MKKKITVTQCGKHGNVFPDGGACAACENEKSDDKMFTHEGVDAFWRVWKKIGEPHKHGVYESTWAAFRAARKPECQS